MGGMKVQRRPFLTLERDDGEWSVAGTLRRQEMNKSLVGVRTPVLTPCRRPLANAGIERLLGQPDHSLLTRLSYAGSTENKIPYINFKRSICSKFSFLARKEGMHMTSPRGVCARVCFCVCVSVKP
jgi:hypothetical protein